MSKTSLLILVTLLSTKSLGNVQAAIFNTDPKTSRENTVSDDLNAFNSAQNPSALGICVISSTNVDHDDDVPVLPTDTEVELRIFGVGLTSHTLITFTEEVKDVGDNCLFPKLKPTVIELERADGKVALVTIRTPKDVSSSKNLYLCLKDPTTLAAGTNASINESNRQFTNLPFRHQGSINALAFKVEKPLLPVWATILIIIACFCVAFLYSGLNLGLMALEPTELEVIKNAGSPRERKFAKIILPVRERGNYLLCSILLGNTLVNSISTVLLESLTTGLIAVVFSTVLIVIFGEILPQAICSRYALFISAKTIWITKGTMVVTAPISWFLSKGLNCILGEEIRKVYDRERLKELIKQTTQDGELDCDEVNIISGALDLRTKTVCEIMTPINDVFMLNFNAILDFETISQIVASGYSRIPVYDTDRTHIVSVLYTKDLAFVDADDRMPLKTLCKFYQYPCNFVEETTTLDVMFKDFKDGQKGHLAFVYRAGDVVCHGDSGVNIEKELTSSQQSLNVPATSFRTIGLVTLEDVIEEIIQAEIVDETDVFTDNRSKQKRSRHHHLHLRDFITFVAQKEDEQYCKLTPQLTLATYQFLNANLDSFKDKNMSETILRRLLQQDIVYHIRQVEEGAEDLDIQETYIYVKNKPADYFVLLLEGRVEVQVGREDLKYEAGPFCYFGEAALIPARSSGGVFSTPDSDSSPREYVTPNNRDAVAFVPDYTVRAITDVIYLKIKRALYTAARCATQLERSQTEKRNSFHEQVD